MKVCGENGKVNILLKGQVAAKKDIEWKEDYSMGEKKRKKVGKTSFFFLYIHDNLVSL